MTTEEQHAAIGRAYADLKANKEKLKALQFAARELGVSLHAAGEILAARPEHAGLKGESSFPTDMTMTDKVRVFDRKIFNADAFLDITNSIRETMLNIERLENTLK